MQDLELTKFRFQYSVGRTECPACASQRCLLFGTNRNPWVYCFDCFSSGTREFVAHGDNTNMRAQLSIRNYIHRAKQEYSERTVPAAERMRYGIPGHPQDPVRVCFFDNFLCMGRLSELRDTLRTLGHLYRVVGEIPQRRTFWKRTSVFAPLEQYPGLVSGVCVFTPDGPVCIRFARIRERVPPKIFLQAAFVDRTIHFDTLEKGLSRGVEHAVMFPDAITLTCSPV